MKQVPIETLNDLELNASLLAFPGQMISGDPIGCQMFVKKFARNKEKLSINFEDFIRAFLPVHLESAQRLLMRAKKFETTSDIADMKQVFHARTFAQYSLTWKQYFQELRQIEMSKKAFMRNNCYDIERVYFSLDQARKGFFDRFDMKVYLYE